VTAIAPPVNFVLPAELAAHEPPEARGLARDEVKLMVSRVSDDEIVNTCFFHLPDYLAKGDVLVVNNSATINAAFNAGDITLHLSTPLDDRRWVVELRRNSNKGTTPFLDGEIGQFLSLPGGASAYLLEPYQHYPLTARGVRLWIAELRVPGNLLAWSNRFGNPIRYDYVPRSWPLSYYQTVFASEPGSAEMPSAGRAFTADTIAKLENKGVVIAPLTLHTGVSSLETGEAPYPERFRVPAETARAVNDARAGGGRIVAVGTTVVRALESVASYDGSVHQGEGWTDLVITPERGVRAVDAILTGLHAPDASHLSMLEAFASGDHLSKAYGNALDEHYLWHEFGDMHLILP
jgi:S-adenosylmethionine:tRNA ribosyltransferase-isomerase